MNQVTPTHHDLDPESLRLNLPDGPGVYLFKDRSDQVVYVGKANPHRYRKRGIYSGEKSYKGTYASLQCCP
jgi:excinuclease UvrABC nuclease subunit